MIWQLTHAYFLENNNYFFKKKYTQGLFLLKKTCGSKIWERWEK